MAIYAVGIWNKTQGRRYAFGFYPDPRGEELAQAAIDWHKDNDPGSAGDSVPFEYVILECLDWDDAQEKIGAWMQEV